MNKINSPFSKRLENFNYHSDKATLCKFLRSFLLGSNPFWILLSYFVTMSLVGYMALSVLSKKSSTVKPKDLDLFFTSVSATTVSSMSTIEMEVFSNSQLIILTILMLFGGEIFTSMIGILIEKFKFPKPQNLVAVNSTASSTCSQLDQNGNEINSDQLVELENGTKPSLDFHDRNLKYNSLRYLSYVVLGYFLVVHIVGSVLVYCYMSLNPFARQTLVTKNIKIPTFSVFTVVSTFTNCGFIPTNENMIIFKKDSVLLLLLIPQILLGNPLYPPCLRFTIWIFGKITKRREFSYLLTNSTEIGYDHLLSGIHSNFLALTVFGFILVQMILFCATEWGSEAMAGMSFFQKLVASLFQVVNSRHAGESVFDLSAISSAVLVLFVVMMYLPPHTSFLPKRQKDSTLSQLSYLAIFVILICLAERERIKSDPLNFNVLNITIEIISAYGNVGFSVGYSCKRQLKPSTECIDKWYGFAGRWSPFGKAILIVVMFFGRFKKFTMGDENTSSTS